MKKFYFLLTALCVAMAANAADWYLIGAFNGWSLSDPAAKFTDKGAGIFELEMAEVSTSFKINDGTWANQYGAGAGKVELGTPYTLSTDGGSGNINFLNMDAIQNAKFVLDTNNGTLLVTGEEKVIEKVWYICGIGGNYEVWGDKTYEFTKTATDGIYELIGLDIAAGTTSGFKISTANWAEQYGAVEGSGASIQYGQFSAVLGEVSFGGDVPIGLTGKWDVTWDYNNLTVSFKQNTGVQEIEFNTNEAIEYFNLQGVRVENPANGLYIAKQGNKVAKVLVK